MKKLLLLYASQKGSTAEVASFMSEILQYQGFQVDLANVDSFTLKESNYDGIIVGSGIYAGMLQPELLGAIRRFPKSFTQIPIWGFALCLRILEKGGEEHIQEHYLPHKTFDKLNLQNFHFFAGKIHNLTISDRALLAERYDGQYGTRLGDYRDWDAIQSFTLEIADTLR